MNGVQIMVYSESGPGKVEMFIEDYINSQPTGQEVCVMYEFTGDKARD